MTKLSKITFTVPANFGITDSSGDVVTITPKDWNTDFLMRCVEHALTQKVNDGGAGALAACCPDDVTNGLVGPEASAARKAWITSDKANVAKVVKMRHDLRQAVATTLSTGDWGVTRGPGVDPLQVYRERAARNWIKAGNTVGAPSDRKLEYMAWAKAKGADKAEYVADLLTRASGAFDGEAKRLLTNAMKEEKRTFDLDIQFDAS